MSRFGSLAVSLVLVLLAAEIAAARDEPGPADAVAAWAEAVPADARTPRVLRIGAMSVERAAHQATLLPSGQVLITGGCAGRGCERIHASAERYDPATGTFEDVAPMSTPRASHAAVALADGRVLVSGGWTGERATARAELCDPAADAWIAVGDMTEPRASHVAAPLHDGRILMMGGGQGRLGNLATAEVFDPATTTFTAVGPMHTNHYLATTLADGRVLVTGGQGDDGEILRSAEIFDPATNAFEPTGDMDVARVKHAAALLADGRVLVLGGSDGRGFRGRFASTEIYDPSTGRFSPGPEMREARHKLRDAVVVLPSGAVLVAGGAAPSEIFAPVEEAFVAVEGELSGPQMFATATLLPSGDVLVLGGYDEHTRPSASAWLVHTGAWSAAAPR